MKKIKVDWLFILAYIFVWVFIALITAWHFGFDLDKFNAFLKNTNFGIQTLIFIFNFVFPFIFAVGFSKFYGWFKTRLKYKEK